VKKFCSIGYAETANGLMCRLKWKKRMFLSGVSQNENFSGEPEHKDASGSDHQH
jgi:hypothetical protein